MAAGVPLVEMAGGIVTNYPFGDFDLNTGRILACNPKIQIMTLQPASGARDLNPQQVRKHHLIASKLSSLYQLWGYERISPPHIERLDTLMAAGGISNNEILKIVSD